MVVNAMRACDKVVKDKKIVEKILRTLTLQYDHIAVAIEESKNMEDMKVEELQNSLEAHEQRLLERKKTENETSLNQALQARSSFKPRGQSAGRSRGRARGGRTRGRNLNVSDQNAEEEHSEHKDGSKRGGKQMRGRGRKNVDKRNIQFYTCSKKEWLIDLDSSVKSRVRFADNNVIMAEGAGRIMIRSKNGQPAYMNNVLYVPKMKSNLLSLGHLLEKGYTMNMHQKHIEIFDDRKRLVLKAPLAKNKTFKVKLSATTIQCLSSINIEEEEWLWHYRYGHLNFRSLR
ncbi:uncharacterized protein LOC108330202 [Vigna angularis]|uniref:uncharacterized protein LOC108330202 n=1 Tax=Phaseolus angularis TaxID=3914 RepID=UPI0022B5DF74|nr:uncharacterized protein LOC108330202 [Vigna angularis]